MERDSCNFVGENISVNGAKRLGWRVKHLKFTTYPRQEKSEI